MVIDNYDSFTFNLVQYLGEFEPNIVTFKNDEITLGTLKKMNPSHIVISPGPGTPERAGITLKVIETFSGITPLLGVCLGYQAMAMVFGGNLCQAPKLFHGKTSEIFHDQKGIFKEVKNPFNAMRYHSWIVDIQKTMGDLEVTAWTHDHIPMALRHKKFLVEGVQFHPESILTKEGKKILKNFHEQSLSH